jgi:phosphohistidine phosphatase SixA
MPMNVVLMRHAERKTDQLEEIAGLTFKGKKKAKETALAIPPAIKSFGKIKPIKPFDIILHGGTTAATETATTLQTTGGGLVETLVPCTALSPGQESKWPDIRKHIEEHLKGPLGDESSVALVGHDPGISSLLSWLTAKNCRIIERGEAVLLTGRPCDMDRRDAIVVRTFGSTYSSELLRKKVEMKMTVSTFLAGFTIPVLVELVKDPSHEGFSAWRALATVIFTLSLGLFVVAVYTYDALLMPSEFWGPTTKRVEPKKSHSNFSHDYWLNGPLYAYMMRTWTWIFTPAVFCSAIAFLLLLIDVKVPWAESLLENLPWLKSQPLVVVFCLLAIFIFILRWKMHPRLGIKD